MWRQLSLVEVKLTAYNPAGKLLVDILFTCEENEIEEEALQTISHLLDFDSIQENNDKLHLANCSWFLNGLEFRKNMELTQITA